MKSVKPLIKVGKYLESSYKLGYLKKFSHGVCLDAGCGDGAFLPLFNGDMIIGVDVNVNRLRKAKLKRGNFHLVLCHLCFLPFRESVFNFIWESEVIGYLSKDDGKKMLEEIKRTSKGNSYIVITTSLSWPSLLWSLLYKIRRFHLSIDTLKNEYGAKTLSWYSPSELVKLGFKVHGVLRFSLLVIKAMKVNMSLLYFISKYWSWLAFRHPRLGTHLLAFSTVEHVSKLLTKG